MRSPNPEGNRVLVVGCGRAGASMALSLSGKGFAVSVADRDTAKARVFARRFHLSTRRSGPFEGVVLAVPDPLIPGTARALAREGRTPGLAVHLSGATPVDALAPLAKEGWRTAKMHPVFAFPSDPAPLPRGVVFGVRASAPASLTEVRALARRLGGKPVLIREGMDAAWHLACVLAGNGLFAQLHAAGTIMADASGKGVGAEALAPLVASSLRNALQDGLPGGLTGPVARGDAATLEGHLSILLERYPEFSVLYAAATALLIRSMPPHRQAALRRRLKRGGLLI